VSGVTYAELAPCRSPIGLIQAMITSPPPISLSTPLASLTPCSPSLRLSNFPISSGSDASPLIPDLFHAQKVYIFKALEQDAFPRFLRAKAFSNLTPLSSFVRLIAGLFVLWGAFVPGLQAKGDASLGKWAWAWARVSRKITLEPLFCCRCNPAVGPRL
jgi:hypothetical protein